jgi:hypothetical protein
MKSENLNPYGSWRIWLPYEIGFRRILRQTDASRHPKGVFKSLRGKENALPHLF